MYICMATREVWHCLKIIIYWHGRVEANGWKRTGKYSGDSAKRTFFMIHSFVIISEMLLRLFFFFLIMTFLLRRYPSLPFPPSMWELSRAWSTAEVLFLLAQSILFSPQHEGGAIWQLNPTLVTIPSTCLTCLFNSCTVPFAPLLCFHLYLYLDFCLLCECEREESSWEAL